MLTIEGERALVISLRRSGGSARSNEIRFDAVTQMKGQERERERKKRRPTTSDRALLKRMSLKVLLRAFQLCAARSQEGLGY